MEGSITGWIILSNDRFYRLLVLKIILIDEQY